MNILILTSEIPYPPTTGARLRTYNLIKHLAADNTITLLTMMPANLALAHLPKMKQLGIEIINVDREPSSRISFYVGIVRNLTSPRPFIVDKHQYQPYIRKVSSLVSSRRFDLIHCDSIALAPACQYVRSAPTILTAHNMEATIWQRYYEEETNRIKKYYIGLQHKKVFQFEKDICRQFSEVIAVSEEDKKRLEQNYQAKNVEVVPNGVDTQFFSIKGGEHETQDSMVFTGSMDWRPNQDAILYFSREVWPLIKGNRPNATLWIVGRKPPAQIRALIKTNTSIHVTGMVDDVRPYIERASVYIVPLRIGGGSRLKILEALAMQKAVVSTSIGAEGLRVTDGHDIVLADNPLDLAESIIALFDNAGRRRKLGEAGRSLVIDKYDWSLVAQKQQHVWDKVSSTKTNR